MIELLCRTEAGHYKRNRKFGGNYILKHTVKPALKSKLKDTKLEDRMKAAELLLGRTNQTSKPVSTKLGSRR